MSAETVEQVSAEPCDLDCERVVLGSALLSADFAAELSERIARDDLWEPVHRIVYGAIVRAVDAGEPTDRVSLAGQMLDAGELMKIGGAVFLSDLCEAVPTVANAGWAANRVVALARRRRLREAAKQILRLEAGVGDTDTVIEQAQGILDAATADTAVRDVVPLAELIDTGMQAIDANNQTRRARGLSTGLPELDALLGGLRPGQLILVAGRPGCGKSVLGLDFARSAAVVQKATTVVFSLEMAAHELFFRFTAAETGVLLSRITDGGLWEDDWLRIADRMGEVSEAPLYISDDPTIHLGSIRATARRLKRRKALRLIVLDYLQLMHTRGRAQTRQEEVSQLSRDLKLMAQEFEVPVVALSQLNRQSEQRGDKKPQLSDLRESGALEQNADTVLLLHRPDYYDVNDRPGELDIVVAKNRAGATGTVTVAAQLHLSRMKSWAADPAKENAA